MNDKRRERLRQAAALLLRASAVVDSALDEEEDALSNLPDGLADSERAEKMEDAIGHLNDALESVCTGIDHINMSIS